MLSPTASPTPPALGKSARRFLAEQPEAAAEIGLPLSAEVEAEASLQRYAGGLVIAYGAGRGYILYGDGRWQRLAAPAPTVSTPSVSPAVGTATPTPFPPPRTPDARAMPTATPAIPGG